MSFYLRRGPFCSSISAQHRKHIYNVAEILLAKPYRQSVKKQNKTVDKFIMNFHLSFQILFINSNEVDQTLIKVLFSFCFITKSASYFPTHHTKKNVISKER